MSQLMHMIIGIGLFQFTFHVFLKHRFNIPQELEFWENWFQKKFFN